MSGFSSPQLSRVRHGVPLRKCTEETITHPHLWTGPSSPILASTPFLFWQFTCRHTNSRGIFFTPRMDIYERMRPLLACQFGTFHLAGLPGNLDNLGTSRKDWHSMRFVIARVALLVALSSSQTVCAQ